MPLPIPNSYWVEAGRLLAGEYPGSQSRAETLDRVQRLLRAGSLAGAQFGIEGIPQRWCQALPQREQLRALARRFGS